MAEARPKVSRPCDEAAEVWRAMGGWFPERLPVILEFMTVEVMDGLFERLMAIRDGLQEVDRERLRD